MRKHFTHLQIQVRIDFIHFNQRKTQFGCVYSKKVQAELAEVFFM